MNSRRIITYILLALVVVALGALAGWYFFLRTQTNATQSVDSARGFNTAGSPFGSTGTPVGGTVATGNTSSTGTTTPPQLWHIATTPAAGIGFATSTAGIQVRYAERASGYILDADPMTAAIVRLSNTLMPKTYGAIFASNERVIEQSLDVNGIVTTFAGHINMGTTTSLSGVTLGKGIEEPAPDPKSSSFTYLVSQGTGVSVVTSGWDGSKQKTIFSSPLSDWRLWSLADGRVILAQKAADTLQGYAYTLKSGVLTPLMPPQAGLTILPRSGSGAIIYGVSNGGAPVLFVQLSASTTAVRLPISTVPDKCVWLSDSQLVAYCAVPQQTPTAGFIDAWYRGEVHLSDAWWKIDASTGQTQLIFTPPASMPVDVVNPVIDDSGAYIAFLNGADHSPWLLRLNK